MHNVYTPPFTQSIRTGRRCLAGGGCVPCTQEWIVWSVSLTEWRRVSVSQLARPPYPQQTPCASQTQCQTSPSILPCVAISHEPASPHRSLLGLSPVTAIRGQTIITSHTHQPSFHPGYEDNTDSGWWPGPLVFRWWRLAPAIMPEMPMMSPRSPSPAPAPRAPMSDSGSGSGCGDSGPVNLMSRVLLGSNLLTVHLSTPSVPSPVSTPRLSRLDNPSMWSYFGDFTSADSLLLCELFRSCAINKCLLMKKSPQWSSILQCFNRDIKF